MDEVITITKDTEFEPYFQLVENAFNGNPPPFLREACKIFWDTAISVCWLNVKELKLTDKESYRVYLLREVYNAMSKVSSDGNYADVATVVNDDEESCDLALFPDRDIQDMKKHLDTY